MLPNTGKLYESIDLNVLREAVSDDMALFRQLLTMYLDMAKPMYDRLVRGMLDADCTECEYASHALISSTLLIGAVAFTDALRGIERLAQEENHLGFTDQLPVIAMRFQMVIEEVKAGLQELDR